MVIKNEVLDDFVEKWSKYDPNATGFIKIEDFRILIEEVKPPLGLSPPVTEEDKLKFIDSLQLATFEGLSKYNFYDALNNITKNSLLEERMKRTSKVLDYSTRQERINKIIEELNFKNNKEEIAAVVGKFKIYF